MTDVEKFIQWIKESKKTVFFGGAGVSTESGLKDFRSKDGLYNEKYDFPPEEILSHHFFMDHTDEFYKFYRDKLNTKGFKANITHIVLAEMEERGLLSSVITQNIDGFHQEAGSKKVLELHGSIKRNTCMKCHKSYDEKIVFDNIDIPRCSCGGLIKPDVVLYEEGLDDDIVRKAIHEIATCDLLIIGGTSLNVYPAASFIHYFKGKHIVLINRDATPYDSICDLVIHDNIGNVFKEIKKQVIK
ncbi:MAG: NAD-dependent protein deacylase [Bacilli bacterium]|nr:NAD-dependent protein deacylase [Bacilli bacterium]